MGIQIEHLIVLATAGCVLVVVLPRLGWIMRYALPIVIVAHVVATVIIGFVPSDILHLGYLRVVVVLGVLAISIPKLRLDAVGVTIVVLFVYMTILLPLSSDPVGGLDNYMKVCMSLFMYILAFSLVRNSKDMRRAMGGMIFGTLIITVSFLIAQIFGLGSVVYGEEGAYTGGGDVHQTVLVAYYLISLPLLFEVFRDKPAAKWLAGIAAVGGVLVVLLIFRRGSMLAVAIGLSVWAFLTPQKKMVARGAAIAGVLAIIIAPLVFERVSALYQDRIVEGRRSYAEGEAGRMQDIQRAIESFATEGVTHALLGSEVFNDRKFYGTVRPIHVDYARILVGMGVIGLGLYMLIFLQVVRVSLLRAIANGSYQARAGCAVACGLVAGSLFVSFSSQIYVVSSLSWLFLLLGAINGWFREGMAEAREAENIPEEIPEVSVELAQLERGAR